MGAELLREEEKNKSNDIHDAANEEQTART